MKKLTLIVLSILSLQSFAYSQVPCNDITTNDIEVLEYNCETQTVSFCLPINFNDLSDYEVMLNGALQTEFQGCGESITRFFYDLQDVQNTNLPFQLESWEINGITYLGDFSDSQELLDSINVWDAPSVWTFGFNGSFIVTENSENDYSDMFILIPSTGFLYQLGVNTTSTPAKVSIEVSTQSNYFFEITNLAENCTDSFSIEDSEISTLFDCQDFAPIGAQWHYSDYTTDGSNAQYTRIDSDRDSIVSDNTGEMHTVSILEVYKNETYVPEARTLIRHDDDRVYYYEFDQFMLLYDFNLEAGDVALIQVPAHRNFYDFSCNNPETYYIDQFMMAVDSVSYTDVQGERLKVLHTHTEVYYDGQDCYEFGRITQKIGSEYGLFGRHCTQCLAGFPGKIRCYSDNRVDFNDFNEDCDFDGIDTSTENKQDYTFELYPNPTDGDLILDTEAGISAYRILDISGKILIQQDDFAGQIIHTHSLSSGLYFIEFLDSRGSLVNTKKIIKR